VREFERVQMGLEAKVGGGKKIVGREDRKVIVEEEMQVDGKRGEKRKFELDEDELLRIARDERTKARKAIDDEKVSPLTISPLNQTN
jgi:nitric oxide synthase-interacting protein